MDSLNSPSFGRTGWLPTSGAFFLHFLSLGFAVFPLQTHLRKIHSLSSASVLASFIPVAGLLTFFLFGFAERRQWTKYPGRLLLGAALAAGGLQFLLGAQLAATQIGQNIIPPFLETAACLLMLACAHACCMNLLNHLAVANLGDHAYSARAAGSAGYMVAILATAALLTDETMVLDYHLFLAAACAVAHVLFVTAMLLVHDAPTPQKISSHSGGPTERQPESNSPISGATRQVAPWRWRALILLVCLTSFCEGAFGLYSHEFLTTNYGDWGYYLFAVCILLETILLVCMPFLPTIRKRLLFVGPLGWMLLLTGCLIAQAGWPMFGSLALAMAMNCSFQVSCNENAYSMKPKVTGLAAIMLAQTGGVFCSQWVSAFLNRFVLPGTDLAPWTILWCIALLVALGGLALSTAIQKRQTKSLRSDSPSVEH